MGLNHTKRGVSMLTNPLTDEQKNTLLMKIPSRWNSDKSRYEQDAGYVAAVQKGDGSHQNRLRKDSEGNWVPRGKNSAAESYKPQWKAYDRPLPGWAQKSGGEVEAKRFIKIWNDCDDLDQLARKLFWIEKSKINTRMRKLKKWLNDHGLSSPPILKDPKKMIDRNDILDLLHSNTILPLDKDGKVKDGKYVKNDDGTYSFVENE